MLRRTQKYKLQKLADFVRLRTIWSFQRFSDSTPLKMKKVTRFLFSVPLPNLSNLDFKTCPREGPFPNLFLHSKVQVINRLKTYSTKRSDLLNKSQELVMTAPQKTLIITSTLSFYFQILPKYIIK